MIHNLDSADLVETMGDERVDLLHTDVPYNLGGGVDLGLGAQSKTRRISSGAGDAYDLIPYDYEDHIISWGRLMAQSGVMVVWCADDQLSGVKQAMRDAGSVRVDSLVWHRTDPMPVIRKSRLLSAAQFAAVGRWEGPCRLAENWPGQDAKGHNVWTGPGASGGERRHLPVPDPEGQTTLMGQKPQWLAVRVAKFWGKPGGLCLDPCSGTGSLLVGAKTTGMEVVGSELRPWWAKEANRWLTNNKGSLVRRSILVGSRTIPPPPPSEF